jgi:hypothetical protein
MGRALVRRQEVKQPPLRPQNQEKSPLGRSEGAKMGIADAARPCLNSPELKEPVIEISEFSQTLQSPN